MSALSYIDNRTECRPIVRWAGGKARLVKFILPLVPPHELYCEPFAGGLALLCAKPPSRVEVINDTHCDLITLYRVAKFHQAALQDELDFVLNSRREFRDYCAQAGLTDIQRAARFFMRNAVSFGGLGGHYGTGRTSGGAAFGSREARRVAIFNLSRRLDRVSIEHLDADQMFVRYDSPGAFFFIDPPYIACSTTTYAAWQPADFERLMVRVRALRGSWLLTINDHPAARALLAGFKLRPVTRQKGIENRPHRSKTSRYAELIVTPT